MFTLNSLLIFVGSYKYVGEAVLSRLACCTPAQLLRSAYSYATDISSVHVL